MNLKTQIPKLNTIYQRSTLLAGLTVVLLIFNLLLVFFLPIKDTDFGWHYRCGEEFLKSGRFCLYNEFSYYLPNYQWAYSSFLYDISLALIFDAFGFLGVSIFGSLFFTIIFLILFKLFQADCWVKITALIMIFFLSQNVFSLGYRSQILGLLFFVLELIILQNSTFIMANPKKIEPSKMRLIWVFPLFFFWANSHPSFFLGLLVLTSFLFDMLIREIRQRGECLMTKIVVSLLVILVSALITLLNPFGFGIYQEVWKHFQSPLHTMIAEWAAPGLWQIFFIIINSLLIIYLALIKKIKSDYRLVLLLLFAIFAVSARRNIPLYYIIAFWFISETEIFLGFSYGIKRLLNFITFGFLIIGAIFSLPQIKRTITFDTNYDFYCNKGFGRLPCQAAEKLKDKTGNLFNMYEQGGYLIWKLPQIKVFSDGRMPAWKDESGTSPYQVYLEIIQAQPGWNQRLKKYGTDYLLINNGTFLDLLLREKETDTFGWQEEYRDSLSVIYHKI